jgi:hypothetical protein
MKERRAVTTEQKRQVVEALLEDWLLVPDLRLGQLIDNAKHGLKQEDLYYIEDFDLVDTVRRFVNEHG